MKIKLAVVGGRRGGAFKHAINLLSGRVELAAVCDLKEEVGKQWQKDFPDIEVYTDYDKLLNTSDCNAVLIATPQTIHAEQSIKALDSGRHVLSEVCAAMTIEECWGLVDAVERNPHVYMLAENVCYFRENMIILNMVKKGLFGEMTWAEGNYIHDCSNLMFFENGEPTWRGSFRTGFDGNSYPTHGLGPVCQWLGIGSADRLESVSTITSKAVSLARYAEKTFGKDHEAAQKEWCMHGDIAVTVIKTESGAVILQKVDYASPRPHNPTTSFSLQGTTGAFLSHRHDNEDPLIWLEDRSPVNEKGIAKEWESLWKYKDEFDDPRWKKWEKEASETGHGGGDFFVLEDFVNAVTENKESPIDVYDAVEWSSIIPLSEESVEKLGTPIEVPNFRNAERGSRNAE
ncbi:Gfo/Idh/MocA family oxidoreductase [Planctomycetota bacterium]